MPRSRKKSSHEEERRKELYIKYVEKVYTLCRRYSDCDERARDYTQECFIEVFKNISKYDPTKGELGGWVYVVCRNHVLKILRKEKRLGVIYTDDLSGVTEDEDVAGIDLPDEESLIEAIQSLPDGYRNVVNLYIFEKKSHEEVAKILDISPSTSRSQYARAKKLLKKKLQEEIYVRKEL